MIIHQLDENTYKLINICVGLTWTLNHGINMTKGHCHGNFAIFWSKLLKYLSKSLFFNMKLLIQHWEENTKVFLSEEQTIVTFLKYTGTT